MSVYFDPVLNMPRSSGPSLRIVNPGDGTVNWSMSGYRHPDSGGYVKIWWDTSRQNLLDESPTNFSSNITYNATSGTLTVANAHTFYWRYVAFDASMNIIARSNVYGPVNAPVTGLSIDSAVDDGDGTEFDLTYIYVGPVGYTDIWAKTEVFVDDISVYSLTGTIDPGEQTRIITGLPGSPGDTVDLVITVLGRTGVLGVPSSTVSDSDWIVSGDPEVTSYAAEIETESTIALTNDQKNFLNDWVAAGDTNSWRPFIGAAMFFCWNNLQANLVRMIAGGSGSVVTNNPTVNAKSMTMQENPAYSYISTGLGSGELGITVSDLCLSFANLGTPSGSGDMHIGAGTMGINDYRLFLAGGNAYIDLPTKRASGAAVFPIHIGVRNGATQALYGYNGTSVTTIDTQTPGTPTAISTASIVVGADRTAVDYTAAFMGTGDGMTSTIAGYFLVDTYNLLDSLGAI
jgi:hypothetical protein